MGQRPQMLTEEEAGSKVILDTFLLLLGYGKRVRWKSLWFVLFWFSLKTAQQVNQRIPKHRHTQLDAVIHQ